jgi:ATP-binding cassette, subfamily G (WHITE), member 2, SNQ2
MLLNGRPLKRDFERITGYVEQTDVHNPLLTVREALRYSAKLRQEAHVPVEEKYEYVERVLEVCFASRPTP